MLRTARLASHVITLRSGARHVSHSLARAEKDASSSLAPSRIYQDVPVVVPPDAPPTSSLLPALPPKIARVAALPTSTKALNKLLGSNKRYELLEKDLDETFVRGSGKGGQAMNKLSTSVSLIHKPTGLRVQCQPTRSLEKNRRSARKLLAEKLATLDEETAAPSRQEILQAKVSLKKARAKKRSAKKYGAEKDGTVKVAGLLCAPEEESEQEGVDVEGSDEEVEESQASASDSAEEGSEKSL